MLTGMANLVIEDGELWVRMRPTEAFWAFHRSFSVPLSSIRAVRTPANAWAELRGWRSAGVAIPGRVALGTRRHGDGYDFSCVHGQQPTALIELNGARFGEIIVSVPDAPSAAASIADAAGIARP
jgi:hypothetical protein